MKSENTIPEQQDLAVGLIIEATLRERERCARIADRIRQYYLDLNLGYTNMGEVAAKGIADDIRSGK